MLHVAEPMNLLVASSTMLGGNAKRSIFYLRGLHSDPPQTYFQGIRGSLSFVVFVVQFRRNVSRAVELLELLYSCSCLSKCFALEIVLLASCLFPHRLSRSHAQQKPESWSRPVLPEGGRVDVVTKVILFPCCIWLQSAAGLQTGIQSHTANQRTGEVLSAVTKSPYLVEVGSSKSQIAS